MFRAVLVFVSFLITQSLSTFDSIPEKPKNVVVRVVKLHAVCCFTLWPVVETMSVKRIVIADLNLCTCQTLSENQHSS